MTSKIISAFVLSLGVLLITSSFSATPVVNAGQAAKKSSEGRKLFLQHCATCHGADAKGTGPMARALKKAPADLTRIEKQDGKFPSIRVQRIITGEDVLESHGSRDMPVWGSVLRRKVGEGFAKLEIYNLTKYIESIQGQ